MADKLFPISSFNDESELMMFISSLNTVIQELQLKIASLEQQIEALKGNS